MHLVALVVDFQLDEMVAKAVLIMNQMERTEQLLEEVEVLLM